MLVKPYTCKQSERIYSIGNERITLERLTLWILDNSFIPSELIKIGISIDDIETGEKSRKYHKKILYNNKKQEKD